jgi:hypothetical protein
VSSVRSPLLSKFFERNLCAARVVVRQFPKSRQRNVCFIAENADYIRRRVCAPLVVHCYPPKGLRPDAALFSECPNSVVLDQGSAGFTLNPIDEDGNRVRPEVRRDASHFFGQVRQIHNSPTVHVGPFRAFVCTTVGVGEIPLVAVLARRKRNCCNDTERQNGEGNVCAAGPGHAFESSLGDTA